jgi:sulfopyruvate decarboxylase TPP-binding subunit
MIKELENNDVTHVVWLPDTETSFLYQSISKNKKIQIVPICREAESIPIAAGLWIGGKNPVVMIQNTGLFESGDSIRGLAVDINLPLLIIVGYRGWTRHGVTKDSAAIYTEPTLNAWGLKYYQVNGDNDLGLISVAFDESRREQKPIVCLIGAEYG